MQKQSNAILLSFFFIQKQYSFSLLPTTYRKMLARQDENYLNKTEDKKYRSTILFKTVSLLTLCVCMTQTNVSDLKFLEMTTFSEFQ